jgi:NAD(P)-dependent dehydrogenase (short-subunit alcohol dehydrogenase family)
LINSAGVTAGGPSVKFDVQDWDENYSINVRGTFLCAREAAARMIGGEQAASGNCRIINVSSMTGAMVYPGLVAYSSSKAAVNSMTKSLAREWARKLVSVNAICPGYIETPMTEEWFGTEAGQAQINSTPRRRLVPIETLDDIVLTLCGPAGAYITGSLITLDDGQSL